MMLIIDAGLTDADCFISLITSEHRKLIKTLLSMNSNALDVMLTM